MPVTLWLPPSSRITGAGQVLTPESASAQMKLMVTLSLYQLLPLAARSAAPLIVGGVLSMLTVARSVVVLPALSPAVPSTGWPWPSVVTVWGAVQLATPERVA